MTRRRRAAVLLGLALVLGTLAAVHMARREAALRDQLGPLREVVVARRDLPAGVVVRLTDLGVRWIPKRYAPQPAFAAELAGRRLAVAVAADAPVSADLLERRPSTPEASAGRGARAVELVATGSAKAIVPGARVDVLVTTEHRTRLALENVEVLAARPGAAKEDAARVVATLRVGVADAVYLVAAQSFARDVRLLARAPGDERAVGSLVVGERL